MDYILKYYPKRKENDMRNDYAIGYLDGRNHAIASTVKWVKKTLSNRHSSDEIMRILSDRDSLEAALFDFDSAFFNNYDPNIGPTE